MDTVGEIISVGQSHTMIKAKDNGMNAVKTLKDNLRRGDADLEIVSLKTKLIL
jgi:hypothetical protein